MQILELINKASEFYNQENYKLAHKYVDKVLRIDSHNSLALTIKGNILYQNQQIKDSLYYYQQALLSDSQNFTAQINLANTYFELKNYAQSYQYAQQVLAANPTDKTALTIYGNSAIELEKYDDAKSAFLRILETYPDDSWSYNSLSQIYQKTEDFERALSCGWKAVELSNGDENHHINFGYLLYEISLYSSSDSVQKYAKLWINNYENNHIVQHMGNSVLNNQKIKRANAGYVQDIFDAFAPEFEDVLSTLNYNVPQLISAEVSRLYDKKIKILDIGCGTGLCGKFLHKYSKFLGLYGVDISEKMLEKAKQKKIYNCLINDDLEHFFQHNKKHFDLIVSADVFTYFGDLQKLILGCYGSLNFGGRIIFSVSKNTVNNSHYFLHTSGRFLHHKNYIENILVAHHFSIEKIEEKILRNEGENKVLGYIVVASKKVKKNSTI